MSTTSCQLILGSASPRRKELLGWSWLPFTVITSDIEEKSSRVDPAEYTLELALAKAENVFRKAKKALPRPVVVGSDTVVELNGKILEKPQSVAHAREILQELSGKIHCVHTAVAVVSEVARESFCEKTMVEFEKIDPELLELYLKTQEPMDKAGAYGIQGAALAFISSIQGSYSNVVGLPLNSTLRALEKVAGALCPDRENWRECFESA